MQYKMGFELGPVDANEGLNHWATRVESKTLNIKRFKKS